MKKLKVLPLLVHVQKLSDLSRVIFALDQSDSIEHI